MSDQGSIHICQIVDTTTTLCGQPAARTAAINYSEFRDNLDRSAFCYLCLTQINLYRAQEDALFSSPSVEIKPLRWPFISVISLVLVGLIIAAFAAAYLPLTSTTEDCPRTVIEERI